MKKKVAIILILTVLVSVLFGCAPASEEKLTIHIVYAQSEEETGKDALAADVAAQFNTKKEEDASATEEAETDKLAKRYFLSVKNYYCETENYGEQLAEAAKGADIVICVGEQFGDLSGVAASNPKVRWLWVGGDVAVTAEKVAVVASADEMYTQLSDFIENGMSDDYRWA